MAQGNRSSFQKALERWPLFWSMAPSNLLVRVAKIKALQRLHRPPKKKLRAPFRSKCSFKGVMGSIDRSSILKDKQRNKVKVKNKRMPISNLGPPCIETRCQTRQETMQGDKLDGALDSSGHPDFRRKNTSKLSHSLQCQKKPVVDNYEGWYFPLYLEHVLNPWELPQNPTV